jgi:hypothetical protein
LHADPWSSNPVQICKNVALTKVVPRPNTQQEELTMADFLSDVAAGAGLEDHEAHHGIGAMLDLLKGRLSSEAFGQLKNAIPNSERMLSDFRTKAQSAGSGFLDSLTGMAGKLFGGLDADAMQKHFSLAGLSADKLGSLLPQLHDMLAGKIPAHILDQIKQHIPGFGPAEEPSEAEADETAKARGNGG